MLAKRIIPCLDIRDGKTVKGIEFVNITEVGDPVELGARYAEEGADELCYLDITASHEKRKLFSNLVKRVAARINIPFTVGGGITEVKDAERLLAAGADKITLNSSAIMNPSLINIIASSYGNQFVVVAIDARLEDDQWVVYRNGGRIATQRTLFEWALEAENRGAGEILFTSMNHDGVKKGFANAPMKQLSDLLKIPIIASGGAGTMEHFETVFTEGGADAGLAASIFHYNEIKIPDLKRYLSGRNIPIRIKHN